MWQLKSPNAIIFMSVFRLPVANRFDILTCNHNSSRINKKKQSTPCMKIAIASFHYE